MDHFKIDRNLVESIMGSLKGKGCNLSLEQVVTVVDLIREEVLYQYVERLISQVETILEINPSLSEKEILEAVAKNVVDYLEQRRPAYESTILRREEMVSFGSHPWVEDDREQAIPFEDTIAGEVVKTHRSYFVPDIANEEKYKNKEKVLKKGIHSMLAIPIFIPRFSLKDVDIEGCFPDLLQEKDRTFTPLEAKIAEMLSRRVSYVVARKRIMGLQLLNVTKDKIVEKIFLKLGKREGIKMKDFFNMVIPELVEIIRIQRCALFSVGGDRKHVILEAGYPESQHGLGKVFDVEVPYINAIVNQTGPFGEFENEKVYPTYILIHNPRESCLLPADLQRFLENQQINSVLYIPLKVNDVVTYFLVVRCPGPSEAIYGRGDRDFHLLR